MIYTKNIVLFNNFALQCYCFSSYHLNLNFTINYRFAFSCCLTECLQSNSLFTCDIKFRVMLKKLPCLLLLAFEVFSIYLPLTFEKWRFSFFIKILVYFSLKIHLLSVIMFKLRSVTKKKLLIIEFKFLFSTNIF